jgi:hypothetical protein
MEREVRQTLPRAFEESRVLRWLGATFVALLIGALGNGLWEVALSPAFDWAGRLIIGIASSLSDTFADRMYAGVSRDPARALDMLPYAGLLSLVVLGPWFLIVFLLRMLSVMRRRILNPHEMDEPDTPEAQLTEIAFLRRVAFFVGVPTATLISVVFLGTFYQDAHAAAAGLFVERSIAIVAPHVDQGQILELQAMHRSIEDAADFYALEDSLRTLAARVEVELPSFRSFR